MVYGGEWTHETCLELKNNAVMERLCTIHVSDLINWVNGEVSQLHKEAQSKSMFR